ncbi:MAG: hypothetical protein AB7G44_10770 [Bacteroidia bacterium]
MANSNYLDNRFDNATRKNRKRMLTASTDTDAKLSAQQMSDADIAMLFGLFHPVFALFAQLYASWLAALGVYKGETLRLENKMKELSKTKIREWEGAVQALFIEGSEEYTILFPNKRKPFQTGTYEQRLAAVEGLGERLGAYPALLVLKTAVDVFATDLRNIRLVQQQKEQLADTASTNLEQQRVLLAVVFYGVLGFLMYKFRAEITRVTDFIDFSLLNAKGSDDVPTIFEREIPANSVDNITEGFAADQEFEIEVLEGGGAYFYTADSKTQTYTGSGIFRNTGPSQKFTVPELGGMKEFLNVHNQTGAMVKVKITLVEPE